MPGRGSQFFSCLTTTLNQQLLQIFKQLQKTKPFLEKTVFSSMVIKTSFMHVFLVIICAFLSLCFPLVREKDEKICFYAETDDFNQPTACRAPFRWSKYTTDQPAMFGLLRTHYSMSITWA